MTGALGGLLPIAIAGAFVPTWTSRVLILLATRRPIANSAAFVLGNVVFRLLLGSSVLLAVRTPQVVQTVRESDRGVGIILAFAAVLMFSLSVWLWRKPIPAEQALPAWMLALESIRPWMSFLYGIALVAAPGVQYVYFMSGMALILDVDSLPVQLLLLTAFVCLLQTMLVLPVVVYVWKRDQAETTLNALRGWMARNGQKATALLVGLFAAIALAIGLENLLGP